jgi:hypothetical protein
MAKLMYDKKQFKNDEEYKKFLEEKWQSLKGCHFHFHQSI